MRAVLTGATGFLGGAIMQSLLDDGWQVLALGRNPEKMRTALPQEVECGLFDLAEPKPPQNLRKDDIVIHCAALLGNADADRNTYLRANTESVIVLAMAARKAEAGGFLFFSSVSANGPIGTEQKPLCEESPFRPASIYGESKELAEKALAKINGLKIEILRPPVIYGPGANNHSSASKIFRMMKGKWFLRSAGGHNFFNVISRDNLVDATLFLVKRMINITDVLAADPGHLPPCPETWMVRDNPCPSMKQMQDWISDVYGHSPRYLRPSFAVLFFLGSLGDWLKSIGLKFPLSRETARGFATSGYYSDMSRLLKAGWIPPVNPEKAVKETAEFYHDPNRNSAT
jgi:nucleoside-diphosphate-sugar epimerase